MTAFCTHLAPPVITHILRICLIAEHGFRIRVAAEKEAHEKVRQARRIRE